MGLSPCPFGEKYTGTIVDKSNLLVRFVKNDCRPTGEGEVVR